MNDTVLPSAKDAFANLGAVDAPILVRQQAFERLRDGIITGQLPPGTRLIERELCEAMGVSRTSIREVLRRLEAEKLIHAEPRKGLVVARVTKAQAEDIYDVRAYLEGLLIRRFVAKANDADISRLEEISAKFSDLPDDVEVVRAVTIMVEFYDHISTVVQADVVQDILNQLMARVSYLRATSMSQSGRMHQSMAEIARIVEAIKRRDADAAYEAAVSHVKAAAATALARLAD